MNTKFTLTWIAVAILLSVAACSPVVHPMPILNLVQPVKNDKTTELIPVTARQSYANEPTYPNQKLHSDCVSSDSQRQNGCQEPASSSNAIAFSNSSNGTDITAPSGQSHSACVSEDSQRQESCTQ